MSNEVAQGWEMMKKEKGREFLFKSKFGLTSI